MPLFQRAPETDEEMEQSRPLDLSPDEVAELDEDAWYAKAYRGDAMPQLTFRAVGMGGVLGFFLAFANVYLGLKIGWHIGVALSACILSFFASSTLRRVGLARTRMTILESNCMQSTASAAGFATGNTIISAIPALLLLSGVALPWPVTAAWVLSLAVLGTCIAIPVKRGLINHDRLEFPSGTAAAVLLRSLYSQGEEAAAKARALLCAALASGVVPLVKSLAVVKTPGATGKLARHALLPGFVALFDRLPGVSAAGKTSLLSAWNVKLDYGPALIAAGALVGLRVTLSMIAGGLFLVLVVGPTAIGWTWTNAAGVVVAAADGPGSAWKDIGVWVGAPLLVSSSLLSFGFEWRTIVRAFAGLRGGAGLSCAAPPGSHAPRPETVEVPNRWFVAGGGISGAAVVVLVWRWFDVPLAYGVLAVLLAFALALVACRATGESDIIPTGPMGKIMQLAYGVLMQQNAPANLMTAGITTGASAASASLLTDIKCGHLLGADPRRQFVAQLMGTLPGTVATVLCYTVLVPDAAALTGHDAAFPAPAAQQWVAVARVFKEGLGNLHPMARQGLAWGLVAGASLAILERALPRYKRYLPSATGLGLGLLLPFYQPLSMFLGAAAAALAARKRESRAAELVVPVASGCIVGESIAGVVVAALNNFVLK